MSRQAIRTPGSCIVDSASGSTRPAAALTEYYRRHPICQLKAADIRRPAARLTLLRVSAAGNDLVIVLGL